ncbi:hypothetical protein OpiT1DRAFT_04190 [Opitutaceae bacterium TAV1]|nr:hypothetical protein OpiT1DRAFT_04190 [Opitutaceae bacterium TAV1]
MTLFPTLLIKEIRQSGIIAVLITASTVAAVPLQDWTLSTSANTTATRTPDGVIVLVDNSPTDTPRATCQFPEPVTRGVIQWRARHMQGRGTLVHTLRMHAISNQSWDVAVFNGALWIKKTGETGSTAYVPSGQDWFAIGQWAAFRLIFDTQKNIAQLYLNDIPAPVVELKQIASPISKITLMAGHDIAVGNAAEFADISFSDAPVTTKPVKWHRQPKPERTQRAEDWPALTPAPAEWIVQDKFAQFAAWWPANLKNPDALNAREALKKSMRREALGIGNEFTSAMRLLPVIANSIRREPPYAGAQQSHLYRSSRGNWTDWDRPSNTRIMESVTLLARFYALDQPWNPYHRDAALGKRLNEALQYWLSLQIPEGGFPEYRGFGSGELPSTSFGLIHMVEIYNALKDEPLFANLSSRWVESMKRAVLWNSIPDSPQRKHGISHANQFLGIISGAWHLHGITGEPRWKILYDELTDWWISTSQSKEGWYREGYGREDFAYSQVSDLYGDKLAIETNDPRWIESLRREFIAAQFIVVYEMDKKTAIIDATGHARTTPGASLTPPPLSASGVVTNPHQVGQPRQRCIGWFNHIATIVPEARAFVINPIPAEEATIMENDFFAKWPDSLAWIAQPSHVNGTQKGAYVWDNAINGTYWSLPADSMPKAVEQTIVWKETRFTKKFRDDMDEQELSCVRRPGYYATFRSGRANGKQTLGLGLVWVPGFGTVFVSANDAPRPAFGWHQTGAESRRSFRRMQRTWSGDASSEYSAQLTLSCANLPPIHFDFGNETLVIRTEDAPLHLPLFNRNGEKWTLSNGSAWNPSEVITTNSLHIRRSGPDVTHDALIDFGQLVTLTATEPTAAGYDQVRSVTVTPIKASAPLEIALRRVAR